MNWLKNNIWTLVIIAVIAIAAWFAWKAIQKNGGASVQAQVGSVKGGIWAGGPDAPNPGTGSVLQSNEDLMNELNGSQVA